MNLKEGIGYRSNQGMIWNDLALKSERMAAHSPRQETLLNGNNPESA
jgi:hypothetical protein